MPSGRKGSRTAGHLNWLGDCFLSAADLGSDGSPRDCLAGRFMLKGAAGAYNSADRHRPVAVIRVQNEQTF